MKILITGGTNGMGKGVAKVVAGIDNHAHEIILLCRSKGLGEAVIKELENNTSHKNISMILCDLTRLSDVKNAIKEIQRRHDFLDGIFINAGIGYAAKRIETEDGMDSHFQVNYLSQFMLTLNLLNLLEKSESGGRIVFNVTKGGEIYWDDMQMKNKWSYENGIHQAMVAKRMLLVKLHTIYRNRNSSKLSFIGFEISKTVWSNQINIIPASMRIMAMMMKFFGTFISIEKCGEIMAPLFVEKQEESLKKSGKFITWGKNEFVDILEDEIVLNQEMQERMWIASLKLCMDEKTTQIANNICNA
jgi:short-subunit dehydrogenase involved in D-alanine esterification of teichoic acids